MSRPLVLDVFSRRIVGWSIAGHLRAQLVLGALNMAIRCQQPSRVIHHFDQGCQYTSLAFGEQCCNAMAEHFSATLECELLQTSRFQNRAEARQALFEFPGGWYNPRRRHQSLSQVAPIECGKRHAEPRSNPKPELSTATG